jgi:hypothetical protein
MDAHVLVNTIQDRLRERIEFREIVSGKQSTAEFLGEDIRSSPWVVKRLSCCTW